MSMPVDAGDPRDRAAGDTRPMESGWKDLLRGRGVMGRARFAWWGAGLAALKWNLDRVLLGWMEGSWNWSDQAGKLTRWYLWQGMPDGWDPGLLGMLLACSLPFLYVGVMLTLARLRSARMSGWWVLLFVVPVLKLVFFALLCALPARGAAGGDGKRPGARAILSGVSGRAAAALAVLVGSTLATGLVVVGVQWLKTYGWALFVGSPYLIGFVATWAYTWRRQASLMQCIWVTWASLAAGGALLLAMALEGVVCLVMAAPLAAAMGTVGAMTAWAIRRSVAGTKVGSGPPALAMALIPLSMGLERWLPPPSPVRPVRTVLEVDAPPSLVWRHVVTFSELPAPTEWMFRIGLAYPVRAEMHGVGVGAVRECHFSTGPFVEPITAWDEPRRLAFRVESNPEPMQEWTPYRAIHPPHLEGHFQSRAGEFLLEPLPGGRTRLQGTTWYEHGLWPDVYWRWWSDRIIHAIHGRVLQHVKALAEADRSLQGRDAAK